MLFINRQYCHNLALTRAIKLGALTPEKLAASDSGVLTDGPTPPEVIAELEKLGWTDAHTRRLTHEEEEKARAYCKALHGF